MGIKSEKGREVQKEYSTKKEKEICEVRNLIQVGGSKTKIDGTNGNQNESIKNFSGKSTQVHLTTQKKFIKKFNLNELSKKFIELFCGDTTINNNGKDRFHTNEIDDEIKNEFLSFLEQNKEKIIELIICNGENITNVTIRDLQNGKIYTKSYQEIQKICENTTWVMLKGGVHLKNEKNKTIFHLQREGKKNKNNRFNVLFHIHKNLFLN